MTEPGCWYAERAVMLRAGSVTPAGVVAVVELVGGLRLVELTMVDGTRFTRGFDDLVSVTA